MKLLLDTHILIWSVSEPERLSRNVAAELENPSNELWFSPISVWEILLLAEKGRIKLKPEPLECIRNIIREFDLMEAYLTSEVAIHSRSIDLSHKDPADRFLAATAIVYGLKLVTSDRRLIESRSVPVIANE